MLHRVQHEHIEHAVDHGVGTTTHGAARGRAIDHSRSARCHRSRGPRPYVRVLLTTTCVIAAAIGIARLRIEHLPCQPLPHGNHMRSAGTVASERC